MNFSSKGIENNEQRLLCGYPSVSLSRFSYRSWSSDFFFFFNAFKLPLRQLGELM